MAEKQQMVGQNPIILIPARMASTRLPNKPLAQICGVPMIVQVLKRAQEADCGRVVVAAAEQEIADAVADAGGEAILTDPDLPSGSDRIHAALKTVDGDGAHDVIVNLQGDLPSLAPNLVRDCLAALDGADMSTLVAEISDPARARQPQCGESGIVCDQRQKSPRTLFHPRHSALRRWAALSPYRHLCLSTGRFG